MSDSEKSTLIALQRGISLLELLARATGGQTFSELAEGMELPSPATLSRLIKALQSAEWIEKNQHTGRYMLADGAMHFARAACCTLKREERIQPYLEALSREFHATSAYFENGGEGAMLMAKSEVEGSYHMRACYTSTMHMARNAFASVCLAFRPKQEWKTSYIKAPLPDGSFSEVRQTLEKIRSDGLLVDQVRMPGWCRIVAPVFRGTSNTFLGALGIHFLAHALTQEACETAQAAVRATAKQASLLFEKE